MHHRLPARHHTGMAAPLVVRETAGVADEERVCALFRRIWSEDPANTALTR